MQTVTATEARVNFGRIMQEAKVRPIMVEKAGEQQVVMLSVEAYERLVSRAKTNSNWLTELEALHEVAEAELQGRELPDTAELFREMRAERGQQLEDAIDLP